MIQHFNQPHSLLTPITTSKDSSTLVILDPESTGSHTFSVAGPRFKNFWLTSVHSKDQVIASIMLHSHNGQHGKLSKFTQMHLWHAKG